MMYRLRLWREDGDEAPLLDFPVAPKYVRKLAAMLESVRPILEAGYGIARAAAGAADVAEGIASMFEGVERPRPRGRR